MARNLPCINIQDSAIDGLRDYFINNYRGEKFPKILKTQFYIQIIDEEILTKFLVDQGEEFTKITPILENDKKEDLTVVILNDNMIYDEEYDCYFANTYIESTQYSVLDEKLIGFQKLIADIFSYTVIFFNKESNDIQFTISNCKTKKSKQRKFVKTYNITKEIVKDKIKLEFVDDKKYDDLTSFVEEINTSVRFSEKLEKYMEDEGVPYNAPFFIPFKTFKFSTDKNIVEIYCSVNEDRKTLECVVFKSKIKNIALEISLEKDPNRNFKIYTFDSFNKIREDINEQPIYIAKSIIHLMIINFFYFTHYRVISEKLPPEEKTLYRKNNKVSKSITNTSCTNKKIYLNTKRKVYNIENSLKGEVIKRKNPEYKKFSWQVRGHIRRLKNGKVIYIEPYTCKRKNKVNGDETSRKYVINVNT